MTDLIVVHLRAQPALTLFSNLAAPLVLIMDEEDEEWVDDR